MSDWLGNASDDVKRLNPELYGVEPQGKKKKKKRKSGRSKLELLAKAKLIDAELTNFVEEHEFHPTRKWRFDFAFVEEKVAIEVEGGVYIQGRHNRPSGFIEDRHKYNEAALLGWIVIQVVDKQIKDGNMISWVRRALQKRKLNPEVLQWEVLVATEYAIKWMSIPENKRNVQKGKRHLERLVKRGILTQEQMEEILRVSGQVFQKKLL